MKKTESKSTELTKPDSDYLPTNTELKHLIDKLLTRFENWKVQAETNPNPRIVHSFKSIVSVIDSISSITESKMQYSYKTLSRQMSILIDKVAKLNITITDSLMSDDMIDEEEQEKINKSLLEVGRAAGELISIVMQAFGQRKANLKSK